MGRFNTILINFDSREEQEIAEKTLEEKGICVYEHDMVDFWTEFDISGCTVRDIAEAFGLVL